MRSGISITSHLDHLGIGGAEGLRALPSTPHQGGEALAALVRHQSES